MKTIHVARRRLALIVPLVCAASTLAGVAQPALASSAVGPPVNQRISTGASHRTPALVALEATSTELTTSVNPVFTGSAVTFRALVIPDSGDDIFDGVVAFADWGILIGVDYPTGGNAQLTTSALAAGLHSIKAYYIGTAAYAPSNSPAVYELVRLD